ncbi:S41 family peptidase [Pedobacter duraquae]|uniref:C-terminal processing protease CtpA/Prc n=1 Tax=Pedobacter duraquae TaxID=425511 RepID=A0A4R6IEE8_9SPHI|nr:S41 family peptidase [Pedobacter duraquae]TDO20663.1 C-terminal processing protease CtpA/Prc [Pedobacter duraquae]
MKFLASLLLSIFCTASIAQVKKPALKITYNNTELYTLGKVWGFMKYYQPAVSQGKLDWDQILLSTLIDPHKKTVGQTLEIWIALAQNTNYDAVDVKGFPFDSLDLRNFDLSWIKKNTLITSGQKRTLEEMVTRPAVGNYWSSSGEKLYYSSTTEKFYQLNTAPYRILNLFRIWNVINYFYPYKYELDIHWDQVLKNYIPAFTLAEKEADYQKVLTLLSATINDSHTSIDPTYNYNVFGAFTAPFKFQLGGDEVVVTKIVNAEACKVAGIELGDVISLINGEKVADVIEKYKKFIPASNFAITRREAYNFLFSGTETVVNVEGRKLNGGTLHTSFKRVKRIFFQEWDKDGIPDTKLVYKDKSYPLTYYDEQQKRAVYEQTIDQIGYVEFSMVEPKKVDSIMKNFMDKKGIVFDLRGYNDDGTLLKTFDYLLPKPVLFGIKTQPLFNMPGKFAYRDHIIHETYKYIGKENPDYYKGKVVVLINEYTQSAEELWAMIFKQVPGVIFVGSQTAGADGTKTTINMTNGARIWFSGLGIYYPDGKETQRIGILPDIIVKPTVESIQKNRDLLAETAFKVISEPTN